MWQNLIVYLSRNPIALKALADLIAPMLKNLVKQEANEEMVKMRHDLDTLGGFVTKEITGAINGLSAGQHAAVQSVEQLRLEVKAVAEQQAEREATLRAEVARLHEELASLQAELQKAQATGVVPPPPRRWLPW